MAGVFPKKWIVAFAFVLGGICLSNAAGAASRVAPYDLGYAYQASQNCPGFKLTVPVPDDVKTNAAFLEGVAMVDGMLKNLPQERACTFALRLYGTKDGSAAKIIEAE